MHACQASMSKMSSWQLCWLMLVSESCCLSWSLKHFLGVPWSHFPMMISLNRTILAILVSSILATCPLQHSYSWRRMCLILCKFALMNMSSFVRACHPLLNIIHRHQLWKCSSSLMCWCCRTKVSEPYSRVGMTTPPQTWIIILKHCQWFNQAHL